MDHRIHRGSMVSKWAAVLVVDSAVVSAAGTVADSVVGSAVA